MDNGLLYPILVNYMIVLVCIEEIEILLESTK